MSEALLDALVVVAYLVMASPFLVAAVLVVRALPSVRGRRDA